MKKLKVGVIFGGRSGEHEVSLVSAGAVIKALDPAKYEVMEIGITLDGEWLEGQNCLEAFKKRDFAGLNQIAFLGGPEHRGLDIDIAFPVLHGPYGEDGTIQGLFEMLNIPYVGCGVLASSTSMDKMQCKALWKAAGLSVAQYIGFNKTAWKKERTKILQDIKENIGLPCFVKPANMGSAVGVNKAKTEDELVTAIEEAMVYDRRALVEKAVNAREIECAVLGNDEVVASPVGEVLVGGEFYDFNDKYVNGVSTTQIPAELDAEVAEKIRQMCIKAYKLLDCCGLARVDSFVDRDTGEIFLNEINTMPGFTSISMYPKLMQKHGIEYGELVDRLIVLGMERFKENQEKRIVFESGSDWFKE